VSRCHLYLPLLDSSGNVFPYASVTFNDPDTGNTTSEPIFVQSTGGNAISLPLFCDPAVIDIWTDNPVRLQIVAIVANNVRIQLKGVDLLPEPSVIVQSASPIRVTGQPDAALDTAVLMSSGQGEAAFRVANPLATHQHAGDSSGSVVLTGEDATDFDPYQTWVGYHAGENTASNSTGATALGPHADIQGTNATLAGIGQVTAQTSSGILGDMATVLSSEDGTATNGTTAIGAANVTAQGASMTVVGSLNGPSSPSAVPDNAVVIGAGNVVGAAGSVKIGPNHPTSQAGPNHTTIGAANIAQGSLLPWATGQTPTAIGSTTLAGDPSTALSSDDWFGGVGPLSRGRNDTSWNPSLTTLSGTALTQAMLYVGGDVVVNGQRTYQNTSTTLGFFGATGTVRPSIPYAAGDVSNTQLTSLMHALAQIGLIYVTDVPVVTESGTHTDGTQLEFAETGQSLQWKLPPASPAYRSANPFTVAGNRVVLNAANAPFPTRGVPGIYSSGRSDVSVRGRFGYSAATSSFPSDDLYTGLMIRTYNAQSVVGGNTQAVVTGYLVGRSAVYSMADNTINSTVTTLSTSPAAGDLLQVDCVGTSVTVRVNGSSVATFTDSTLTSRVKHGYRICPSTSAYSFQVLPFGF
jgi:hypothetical protein